MNNLYYRKEITSLRAFAIIPVVFYHLDSNIFKSGYLGVDVFFVISGYLISHKIIYEIRSGTFNFLNFYNKRIRRLFPALVFLILIINFLSSSIYLRSDVETIFDSSIFSLFYLSNFYFLNNTNYFDAELDTQLFLHTWSLSIEEQFYLFMPLFLYFLLRKGIKLHKNYISILISLSFLISVFLPIQYFNLKFYLLPFRLWEFLIGTLTAFYLFENTPKIKFNNLKSLIILTLLIFQFIFPYNSLNHPGVATLTTCICTSLLIIFMRDAKKFNRVINFRIFYFIGLISYSLYLWHDPLIKINKKLNFFENNFTLLPIILIVSTASFYLIENYFRYKTTNKNFYTINIFAIFVILFFIFNSPFNERNNINTDIISNKSELIETFVPNTTIYNSKIITDLSEIEAFTEKTIFKNLFIDYYEKKSVPKDQIAFNNDSDGTGNYLENVCFITGFGFKPTANECLVGYSPEKNNILFIGDSTAHNYYLGLKNYIDNSRVYDNFSLNVLAVTGCIPLVDDYIDSQQFTGKEEKCEFAYKEINNILNNYFFDQIFFSYRYKYFYEHKTEDFIFENSYFDFEKKLIALNKKTELYVIGPSILLTENSKDIFENNLLNENKIYIFNNNFLDEEIFDINKKIKLRMESENINYLSLVDELCQGKYCLNAIEINEVFYRLVYDKIHLTKEASIFFGENLFFQYLNK